MDVGLLRSATLAEHESVERHMPLMDAGLSRELYRATLACIYPLLAGWETWVAAHAPVGLRLLLEGRQRAPLLAADLRCLGAEPSELSSFDASRVPGLGENPSAAAFLGAMYVIEGSTLGGQYIARHVEATLGLTADCGTAYFRGYGTTTGERWKEFQRAVVGVRDEDAPAVIEAAKGMFRVFENAILPVSTVHSA